MRMKEKKEKVEEWKKLIDAYYSSYLTITFLITLLYKQKLHLTNDAREWESLHINFIFDKLLIFQISHSYQKKT